MPLKKASFPGRGCWDATPGGRDEGKGAAVAPVAADATDDSRAAVFACSISSSNRRRRAIVWLASPSARWARAAAYAKSKGRHGRPGPGSSGGGALSSAESPGGGGGALSSAGGAAGGAAPGLVWHATKFLIVNKATHPYRRLEIRGAAQGPADDLISQSWDSQTRDKLFLSRIDPERKEAATTFAHGDKYNCRSQSFLGGRYDLGTAAAALPRALGPAAATTIDIDYYRYRLFVRDLGSTFVGFDTLAYREADLRNAEYPANTQPLFFALGLGVVYLLISASPEDLDSGYTTLAREVEKARDDIIAGIRREGPAIPPQKNSNASLICKTHQAIGGLLLQRVLSALGYDVFYHVTWGIKVPAGDLGALDEAAKRPKDEKPPSDDPEMSNALT
eukprot:jgi/Undpi1/11627/HiC_scaffold_34.g13922.m1